MTNRTVYVGAHVSASGGVNNAPANAAEIGATALSLFTRNQRRWTSKPYESETIEAFHAAMKEHGYTADHAMPHASYLVNLGSPDEEVRRKSIDGLADELGRTVQLGLRWLNFHPGTSKGELDEDATLRRIADGMDRVLEQVDGGVLVLENTAGQGSSMGARIGQLASIIEYVADPDRVAVCIDTCHAFAAGYDIRDAAGWDALIQETIDTVGLDKLVALHLNDSTGTLGSNKDRHKPIGEGEIGMDGFRAIMEDTRLDGKPMILETPDTDRWAEEIALLKKMAGVTA
ncbi:MAG: deoxyribonuclease IV [Spirochaeta sp.]|nr:deoxyribonuclease IV [Spirochaeta sp.]